MRRALVIGSQTGLLQGVDHDAQRVAGYLATSGFTADVRTGATATRSGILDGYARLIDASDVDDVAVVYYSGHGCLAVIPEGVTTNGPFASRRYQCIVPFDYAASTADNFRGILAVELSILLWKLTQKTANAAVILDCCHSAMMSRRPGALPKALPDPMRVGVEACIERLLKDEGPEIVRAALTAQGSDAVRMVACRQEQVAYEHLGAGAVPCGVFTDGLLLALEEAEAQVVSWRDVGERVADLTLARFPEQLPGVEGRADRRLFALDEVMRVDKTSIVNTAQGWIVRRGRVFGVRVGDVYSIRPGLADGELGRATVTAVGVATASVALTLPGGVTVPAGAYALPIAWAEPQRFVHVPEDCQRRDEVVAAIAANPRLVVVSAADATILATATVKLGSLSLVNGEGLPMHDPLPMNAAALVRLASNLGRMAQARALRELHGEGVARVGPEALEFEWGLMIDGAARPMPPCGATIGPGDGLYIRLTNRGTRDLYVHVFDVGVSDRITLLTANLSASGVLVRGGETEVLGRDPVTGAIVTTPFSWPESVPTAQGLRSEEFVCVALAEPVDLAGLVQGGVRAAAAAHPRVLQWLEQAFAGRTRDGGSKAPRANDMLIRRIQFWASPWPVRRDDGVFVVDAQRALAEVASQAGERAAATGRLAVVLHDVRIAPNHPLSGKDLRIDALFVTPRGPLEPATLHARTIHRSWQAGEHLIADEQLLHSGVVRSFLHVCLWLSRDVVGAPDLRDLLAAVAAMDDMKAAQAALAAGMTSSAGALAAATAAVTLAGAARRALAQACGPGVGVYRTSLLAVDGFRVGRYPPKGLVRAQALSFCLEVRVVEE